MAIDGAALDSITQFSFIFTALVSVIGWFVVGYLADRRELRKEARENINELKSRAQAVRDASKKYWIDSSGTEAAPAACILKADVTSLSRQVLVLDRIGLQVDDMLMVAVRQSATGGDFEQKGRRRKKADIDRLSDTYGAVEDLLSAIDISFHARFSRAKRSNIWRKIPVISVLLLAADSR